MRCTLSGSGVMAQARGVGICSRAGELLRLRGWGDHRRGAPSVRGEVLGSGQGGTRSRASADRGHVQGVQMCKGSDMCKCAKPQMCKRARAWRCAELRTCANVQGSGRVQDFGRVQMCRVSGMCKRGLMCKCVELQMCVNLQTCEHLQSSTVKSVRIDQLFGCFAVFCLWGLFLKSPKLSVAECTE